MDVAANSLYKIMNRVGAFVRDDVFDRIMEVEADRGPLEYTPSRAGIVRRIHAAQLNGWALPDMAESVGMSHNWLTALDSRYAMSPTVVAEVRWNDFCELYTHIWSRFDGPSPAAANYARGWPTIDAWFLLDIDDVTVWPSGFKDECTLVAGFSDELKMVAETMHGRGMPVTAISESLDIPYETVRNWVKA